MIKLALKRKENQTNEKEYEKSFGVGVDDLSNTFQGTWDAIDSSVATVSSKGVVTAKGQGITVAVAKNTDGTIVGQVYIRVRV